MGLEHRTEGPLVLSVFVERDVPVGIAQKTRPTRNPNGGSIVEWFPTGTERRPLELHPRLFRSTVRLSGVATHAGECTVFPSGQTASGSGSDVVDRELGGSWPDSAVLAGQVIPLEKIPSAERDGVVPRAIMKP